MAKTKDLKVFDNARKLCSDITIMQSTADRGFRNNICEECRRLSEDIMHEIRDTNRLTAGTRERIEMQLKIDGQLEDLKDLLGVMCGLIKSGKNTEAQVLLSVANVQKPLRAWIRSDLAAAVKTYEKLIYEQSYEAEKARQTFAAVRNYTMQSDDERQICAREEAYLLSRGKLKDKERLQKDYGMVLAKYFNTDYKPDKKVSALEELLASDDYKKAAKSASRELDCRA